MKTKTECHEIEPNPSKNRAMPGGDNPSNKTSWIAIEIVIILCKFAHLHIHEYPWFPLKLGGGGCFKYWGIITVK
jgi:hypothetical protein